MAIIDLYEVIDDDRFGGYSYYLSKFVHDNRQGYRVYRAGFREHINKISRLCPFHLEIVTCSQTRKSKIGHDHKNSEVRKEETPPHSF